MSLRGTFRVTSLKGSDYRLPPRFALLEYGFASANFGSDLSMVATILSISISLISCLLSGGPVVPKGGIQGKKPEFDQTEVIHRIDMRWYKDHFEDFKRYDDLDTKMSDICDTFFEKESEG